MPSAVIFDLFGTLIHLTRDTRPYLRLCRATNSRHQLRESLIVNASTLADFCDYLAVSHPTNLVELQRDLDRDVDSAALFNDSLPTLNELRERGIAMALISNLASPYKVAVRALGLEQYFDCIVFSCDVGIAKPASDIYRAATNALQVDVRSTIMVGDQYRADVAGPKTCGMRGFLIDRNSASTSDASLQALTEVTSLVSS